MCEGCRCEIPAGTKAWYDRPRKKVRCQACVVPPDESQAGSDIQRGIAGASASREYKQRSDRYQRKVEKAIADDAAWRVQVKKEHPVLGRMAAAVTVKPTVGPEPQHVVAWKTGADGERKVGEQLDRWARATGGVVLHDRRIPPGRGNIDHLALNSQGVWVIDAKEYRGMVKVVGGLLSQPELRVGGRRKTHLAEAVWKQVKRVAEVLDAAAAKRQRPPVYGVLCFVGAEWPIFGGPFTVKGVTVAGPAATVKLLTPNGQDSDGSELQRWARVLSRAFPSATE